MVSLNCNVCDNNHTEKYHSLVHENKNTSLFILSSYRMSNFCVQNLHISSLPIKNQDKLENVGFLYAKFAQ